MMLDVEPCPTCARYRKTHWIGAATRDGDTGVFDINAMRATETGHSWTSLADWETGIRPHITAEIPRATGGWHIAELPGPLWTAVERGVIKGLRRAEWMLSNPGGVSYPPDIDTQPDPRGDHRE